ncbi:opsin, ultraviolet-sensitive-like [Aethina tumida]|uniref:opsin, ultraviolet-sensitive-like n=1 Tax=Aethina tumida TaxID=116153 RepID=UPI002147917C|nr:opsin, ultraviolet-sensitive-like [Aethina tumida]
MENITTLINRFYKSRPVEMWKKYGFFDDEYVYVINYYWLQFDAPFRSSHISLAVLYIFIMIVGWLGNMCVIYLYYRNKALRTSRNTLVLNLAISDLLLLSKMPIFIYNSFLEGPALGDIGCRIYGVIGGLTGTVSISTLCAIAFDRFYVLKYPLKRAFSNFRVKIYLVFIWIYGIFFALIPVLNIGLGRYTPEGYLTSCSFDYLSPKMEDKIFIIVLTSSKSKKQKEDSRKHIRKEYKRKQILKLALTVLCAIVLWFTAWTPYAVVVLLGISGHKEAITPLCSMIPAIFCKTASAIDPYIYTLSDPKFRKELLTVWKGSKAKRFSVIYLKPPKNAVEKTRKMQNIELTQISGFMTQKEPTTSSNVGTNKRLVAMIYYSKNSDASDGLQEDSV